MKKLLVTLVRKYALCISMLFGLATAITVSSFADFAKECEMLPEKVLRLHILANSDSQEDQQFKLQLRDHLLETFALELSCFETKEEAVQKSEELLTQIEKSSRDFAKSQNYSETQIKAEIAQVYFPTRQYDTGTFPAGNYTALRITIGEGQGKNWWCVMFPVLCIPAVSETTQNQQQIQPAVINLPESVTNNNTPKIKFAVFEFLSGLFS